MKSIRQILQLRREDKKLEERLEMRDNKEIYQNLNLAY